MTVVVDVMMGVYRTFLIMISILVVHGTTIGSESLMQCSKYHFEEKVLEKLIRVEFKIENQEKKVAKLIENVRAGLDKIEKWKQIIESFMNDQKTEFDKEKENLKKYLLKMETVAENLNKRTETRIDSYSELIENKLENMTASETDRNSAVALLRNEIRSSFESTANSLMQNISTVWTKQTLLQENIDEIRRSKPNIAFTAYLRNSYGNTGVVKFDYVWTNKGNAYNPATGVFTAPITGLYNFAAVLLSSNDEILYRHIWRNTESLSGTFVSDKGYKTGAITVNLELKKGDEVYIKSKGSGNGAVYSDSDLYSTFSGFFIG